MQELKITFEKLAIDKNTCQVILKGYVNNVFHHQLSHRFDITKLAIIRHEFDAGIEALKHSVHIVIDRMIEENRPLFRPDNE